jgi:hypothetical protein
MLSHVLSVVNIEKNINHQITLGIEHNCDSQSS